MKTSILILSAVLLLSLALNLLQWHEAKNMESFRIVQNLQFQDALEKHRQSAATYADNAHHLKVRLVLTRDSSKVAVNALKSKIAVLTGKIRQQAPPTAQEDTICDRFIVAGMQKDTVIQVQDSLISVLEIQNVTQYDDMSNIIRLQDKQISEERAISDILQLQSDNFQRLYLQQKKKAGKRWSVGPVGAYGVGSNGLTPFVGVGVTYSLFKF